MNRWRLHMRASRLIGRADYGAAGTIYEQLLASDASDNWAMMMLAVCYEQKERCSEALALAEECVRSQPQSLSAHQMAARLAVAVGQHDKAAHYLRLALTLPEVRAEIPKEGAIPTLLLWLLRVLVSLPLLRRRFRPDALDELEPGAQALQLQDWKRWAQDYLAWHGGGESGIWKDVVH